VLTTAALGAQRELVGNINPSLGCLKTISPLVVEKGNTSAFQIDAAARWPGGSGLG
jgi:hypothetical protein